MSGQLQQFVQSNYAGAVKGSIGAWTLDHDLPVIVEPKYDGRRVFLFVSKGSGVYVTKHNGEYTRQSHPGLFSILPAFNAERLILDCENHTRASGYDKVVVLDILNVDGKDLRAQTQMARSMALGRLFADTEKFRKVPSRLAYSTEQIESLVKAFIADGYEGGMVKDPNAVYGESGAWLKQKKRDTGDFVILGPDPDDNGYRKTGIAHAWFIGAYDRGNMVPWGRVGNYTVDVNPAEVVTGAVVEVSFQETTNADKLRDAFILRVRDDKLPTECIEVRV
jgi:ATP-dependent DNA ligase